MKLGKKDNASINLEKSQTEETAKHKFEDIMSGKDPIFRDLLKQYDEAVKKAKAVRKDLSDRSDEIKRAVLKSNQDLDNNLDLRDVSKILNQDSMLNLSQARKLKKLSKSPYSSDRELLIAKRNVLSYTIQFLPEYDQEVTEMYQELKDTMEANRVEEKLKENLIMEQEKLFNRLSSKLDIPGSYPGYTPIKEIELTSRIRKIISKRENSMRLIIDRLAYEISKE